MKKKPEPKNGQIIKRKGNKEKNYKPPKTTNLSSRLKD
jgi:hypothetical protein